MAYSGNRRNFKSEGKQYSYNDMEQLARGAKAFEFFIDPDDASFAAPGNMPEKICAFCEKTGQGKPESDGAMIRCIYESLAMNIALQLSRLKKIRERNLTYFISSAAEPRTAFYAK